MSSSNFARLSLARAKASPPALGRLTACAVIALGLLFGAWLNWSVHQMELNRFHGPAPGDFLTLRGNAMKAMGWHLASAVPPQLYPPPTLFLTAPLALLPKGIGYHGWIALGAALLLLAGFVLGMRPRALAIGLITPATLFCAAAGQMGLFIGSLLLIAFGCAQSSALAAGLAAGALIFKPQFGLLLPVCLLAARNYRGFVIAALTVAGLCLASLLCFGPHIWQSYWAARDSNAQDMLGAPWLSLFQLTMVTPFITARSLHAGLGLAFAAQGIVTCGAALATWRLWRIEHASPWPRLSASLCLAALAMPYAYVYDLPALGFAAAAFAMEEPRRGLPALALFCAFTSVYAVISLHFFSTGALFLAALLWLCWPRGEEDSDVSTHRAGNASAR